MKVSGNIQTNNVKVGYSGISLYIQVMAAQQRCSRGEAGSPLSGISKGILRAWIFPFYS